VAAFTEVDKLLGTPIKHCPLNARQLFRPVRVIGIWQLEAAAASIAQRIGLQLPSVNFYAIAQRYLNELSLPVEKILPHACRIYEWAMPVELWLSSNPARPPTQVCVMAILIVSLRLLYNINGQGIWEVSMPYSHVRSDLIMID
jgi:transcription initiation factor TFIIIB Brf1 subunit/transcription initiation factor TFIIB